MKDIPQKYHISLNSGDRSSWESPLLHHVFELLISSLKSKQQQQLDDTAEQSLEFSSLVSSLYNHYITKSTVTSSDEFEDDIKEFLETLSSIGVPSDVIECIRLSKSITNSTDSLANELLNKAKQSIRKHDYVKAVEFCNQGIAVTGLSIESQPKLYFYRGYANEMYRLQSGPSAVSKEVILLDLSRTSAIKPKWKCTLFLMALIYFHDDKFEEAKATAEACLVLDTQYKKAKDLLDLINYDLRMISIGYKDDFQKYDAQQYKDLLKGRNINPDNLNQAFVSEDKNVENGFRYLYGYDGTTKDIAKSLEYFQSSPNNAEALLYSGILLQQGKTVRRNLKDAFDCFVRSKDLGGLESYYQIAKCYRHGLGVDIDVSKAQATLEERIKKSDRLVKMDQDLTELGELYLQNQDPEVYVKAAQYFQMAASSGYPDAMFYLGYVYLNGFGVEKDLEAAEMWLKRAAKMNHPRALQMLNAVKNEKKISELPDSAQDLIKEIQSINVASKPSPLRRVNGDNKFPIDKLERYAKTSKIAANLFASKSLFFHTIELMETGKPLFTKQIISNIARCIEMTDLVLDFSILMEHFLPTLEWYMKSFPPDYDARYCYAFIKGVTSLDFGLSYTKQCLQDYPDSHQLFILCYNLYGFKANWKEGLNCLTRAKEIVKEKGLPEDLKILCQTGICRLKLDESDNGYRGNTETLIADLLEFTRRCEKDDRQRPQVFYHIAYRYYCVKQYEKAAHFYNLGLETEVDQLPFFLPVQSTHKQTLEVHMKAKPEMFKQKAKEPPKTTPTFTKDDLKKNTEQTTSTSAISASPTTLTTPSNTIRLAPSVLDIHRARSTVESKQREVYITNLRDYIGKLVGATISGTYLVQQFTTTPLHMTAKKPPQDIGDKYKEIVVNEFDPNRDMVYKGRFLKGIIVERLMKAGTGGAHSIMMDNKGTYMRISIYDESVENQSIADQTLFVGQGITIIDPYLRVGIDGVGSIRVNSVKNIFSDGAKPNQVCFYCFKASDKLQKCGHCLSSYYCSRDCQVSDYKLLKHKSICFKP
ncbi:hypothetical protein PPL_00966 [Heterostelium album PN500]|uniref:MYND-type domain-containing protein n=1 Tax=Heterostelium pallidum (strain ATCC 26659 / Pp 5 / PN500) TaxID=670386 RepID=D3AXQ9_HETP5|nr:hypothetical protein PPL_00966 [Heterostelium album PN500]EFA85736.1 hypothetical protein PPL_00966 [Heterostelium album PN500]|eukprot:XP_020437842.1 hypothetical protein PPL_00966 [Heterostelium album PN500]